MKAELTPQVLAMYLGCRMQTFALGDKNNFGVFTEISLDARPEQSFVGVICDGDVHQRIFRLFEVKPILRRLSSMSEEEAIEIVRGVVEEKRRDAIEILRISERAIDFIDGSKWFGDGVEEMNDFTLTFTEMSAQEFAILLSKGFDLFGLLDAGLAVEPVPFQGDTNK